MNYTITANAQFNSNEVYFDTKPADNVRLALKRLKMRWNPSKSCWYGYAAEHEIVSAILDNAPEEEAPTVYSDGYLGGGAVYGSKSNKHLYGADLSTAIRADLKAAGIKGVTVKCKTYSGGQHITATVKVTAADFVPLDDFITTFKIRTQQRWIWDEEKQATVHINEYWNADAKEQERLRVSAARVEYRNYTDCEYHINERFINEYSHMTDAAKTRLKAIDAIITAYRYDESNGMVDYFNTNFYYDIVTKPVKA